MRTITLACVGLLGLVVWLGMNAYSAYAAHTWLTGKADAMAQAQAQNKLVLLVAGRDS